MDKDSNQLDKLEFGGGSPLTIRAWCSAFRYCPDPLGNVFAEVLGKLKLGGVNRFVGGGAFDAPLCRICFCVPAGCRGRQPLRS